MTFSGSMTKKMFCVKTPFFAKNAIFSKINVPTIFFCLLIQATNMSNISRNRGATIQAFRKTAHGKVFFWGGGQKGHFLLQKMTAPSKNVIALNLYIGTNVLVYERWLVLKVWYTAGGPAQCFRHYILTLLIHASQKVLGAAHPGNNYTPPS